jgi:hypothetical protein
MITKSTPCSTPSKTYPVIDRYLPKNGMASEEAALYWISFYDCYNPNETSFNVCHGAGSITYDVGWDRFNPCTHVQDKLTWYSPFPSWIDYSASYIRLLSGAGRTPYKPTAPAPLEVTVEMKRRAWASIEPQLNTGFSLFNFLWELKDIPRLMTDVAKWLKMVKHFQLPSSKTAADLHLAYSFAVKPLISDFTNIYNDLLNTEKRVNDFIEKGKKPQNFHYTEVLDEQITKGINTRRGYIELCESTEFHATARLRYKYRKPSAFEGFRRVMGLRVTPEAIWNAIPFSFLVDYVLKVGKFLSQLDDDPNLTVEILDYCDSIKRKAINREIVHTGSPNPSGQNLVQGGEGKPIWEWEQSYYQRSVGAPETGLALPAFDALSMRELVLVAALAHA